jgi:hypothetical protein
MSEPAPVPVHAMPDNDEPAMTDAKPDRRSPTSRAGKTLAGGYLDKTDLFIIQELCLRLGRERGQRMTMQEFVVEALTHECERHGVKLTGKS